MRVNVRVPFLLAIALAAALLFAACSDSDDPSTSGGGDPVVETTTTTEATEPGFAGEVLAPIQETCARCHTGDGPGTPHLRLDTVGDIVQNADAIHLAVSTGYMPPWPASAESVAFRNDYDLAENQRNAILSWASFDPTADIPHDTPVVSSAGIRRLTDVDAVIGPVGGYDGEAGQPDEYRCMIYDPGFTETTWITGYEFVPDQTEVVDHAIGYLAPASERGTADSLDGQHPEQGGWPCFGSSGIGDDEIFLGWAPGQGPTELPDGSGMRMEAGDFVIIQVHYHFEVDAPLDQSTIEFDLAEDSEVTDEVRVISFVAPAEIPCSDDEAGPLCDREAAMAAAIEKYGHDGVQADDMLLVCRQRASDFAHMTSGIATSSCDLPARSSGTIISVLGHEHELGASFRMTLNPGGPEEVVLLDIPRWSFDWQLNYYPVEEIRLSPTDRVRIECSWDRAKRDPDLEPAYILWADGTDDEMCFATIVVREG